MILEMRRFAQGTHKDKHKQKKQWQIDIVNDEDIQVLKEYKSKQEEPQRDEEQPQQGEQQGQQQDQPHPQPLSTEDPPAKKLKQFQWMSDSDVEVPDEAVPLILEQKLKNELKEEGVIDLFVSKIPLKAQELDVVKYVSKYGEVREIFMPLVEGTQIHKRKAFIRFVPRDTAIFAVEDHKLKGQTINISNGIVSTARDDHNNNRESEKSRSRSRSRSP